MVRATSPLPVPVSPVMWMDGSRRPPSRRATNRRICSRTACIAALSPTTSERGSMAQLLYAYCSSHCSASYHFDHWSISLTTASSRLLLIFLWHQACELYGHATHTSPGNTSRKRD